MPRRARIAPPGHVHHVFNRGNERQTIFRNAEDYLRFIDLLVRAGDRCVVPLLAYCLMPNHWHLVLWPTTREALSAYMHWLTSTHVRHLHLQRGTRGLGHIYQERYRSVIVKDERQLLAACRYVEANPVRAGLVTRAELWPYSSLSRPGHHGRTLIGQWPVPRPANWIALVNEAAGAEPEDAEIASPAPAEIEETLT